MCVLAFAWNASREWPVVLIGNRDERHDRPAEPLARWDDARHVIAGRDVEAGGSWLGISEEGRLAVVTNVRNPAGPDPAKASRGRLVSDMLAGSGRYADPGLGALEDFNPFNLIGVGSGKAALLTNRPRAGRADLEPGLYGLSNGCADEEWPKVRRVTRLLGGALEGNGVGAGTLLDALRDDAGALDHPRDVEASPLFILNPVYGTRCSTVVLIDAQGRGTIAERRYDREGEQTGETTLDFAWPVGGDGTAMPVPDRSF